MLDRLRSRALREDEGFTLIELLIVIVILGILAAIVVFAVGNSAKEAKSSACQADHKTVEVAAEAYKAATGNVAAAISDLTGTVTDLTGATAGPFLKDVPNEPTAQLSFANGVVSGTCPASN